MPSTTKTSHRNHPRPQNIPDHKMSQPQKRSKTPNVIPPNCLITKRPANQNLQNAPSYKSVKPYYPLTICIKVGSGTWKMNLLLLAALPAGVEAGTDLNRFAQLRKRHLRYRIYKSSVEDPWNFCTDPDPRIHTSDQGCGSRLDPDSIGSVDPDSEYGSGSRRAKMAHKSRNFFYKFMFWSVGWPLLRAEGLFCNLDVLYGGLGIGKLQFLIKKFKFFSSCNFLFNFWSLKPWLRIGSGLLFSLKCWIRIRMKWMRIRNPASD